MKRNRIFAAATLAGLLAIGSSALYAFDRPCGDGPHGHGGYGQFGAVYHLDNLTDKQRQQFDALRDKERKSFEKQREEHQALRQKIWETTDPKVLRPLAEQEGKYVTEKIMHRAQLRAELDKILTAEQREQLKKEFQERRDKRREHRGDGERGRW